MKSLNHLKHYEISKERLKFINGSSASLAGACVETCQDACWHYIVVESNEPDMGDLQNCNSDCSFFC